MGAKFTVLEKNGAAPGVETQETALNGGINDSVTTITVDSTTDFDASGKIKIEDEIIAYTGKTATTYTGCTRGDEGTVAVAHDDNTAVMEVWNLNFGDTDDHNLDTVANAVKIDENGYEKWIRLHFTGTFTDIRNIKIWKDSGNYVAGETLKYTGEETSYATPVKTTSTKATTNIPTSVPGSANVSIGGSLSGNLSSAGHSDYTVLQIQSTSSTPKGAANTKTLKIRYDEQ